MIICKWIRWVSAWFWIWRLLVVLEQQYLKQLEQLECLHSQDTPTAPWLPIPFIHIRSRSPSYIFKEFVKTSNVWILKQKFNRRHTFWTCLMQCVNMKRVQWILLKIKSQHNSVHRWTERHIYGQAERWTDGLSETRTPPFQLGWSGGIKMSNHCCWCLDSLYHQIVSINTIA